MKFRFAALAAALFSVISVISTVGCEASTYNLALWSNGVQTGTGTLTIGAPISTDAVSTFTDAKGGGLSGLSFNIGAGSFSLGNELVKTSVSFYNGSLASIFYVGISNGFNFALGTVGLDYALLNLVNGSITAGTMTDSVATPLPPSWSLMLLGLMGAGFVASRRKSNVRAATI